MRHYESFENIKNDKFLLGEMIVAENKLDGQNFCARYNPRTKEFIAFGSKKMIVDEKHEQFGGAVKIFKQDLEQAILEVIAENSKKKGVFNGAQEITFYFEYTGDNSFCGQHVEGEKLRLVLIDIFIKKKGHVEPRVRHDMFKYCNAVEQPQIIYTGKLTQDFIESIVNNDWTNPDCKYPSVKEGVVCKRTTILPGQRLPKVKVKTEWWLTKLKEKYPTDWKKFE